MALDSSYSPMALWMYLGMSFLEPIQVMNSQRIPMPGILWFNKQSKLIIWYLAEFPTLLTCGGVWVHLGLIWILRVCAYNSSFQQF